MSATDLQPSNKTSHLRRSQRVCLRLPIVVLREGPGDNVASEETHTLIVNAHGALILRDSGESLSRRQIGPSQPRCKSSDAASARWKRATKKASGMPGEADKKLIKS